MKFKSIVAKEIKAIRDAALRQPLKYYNEDKDLKHLPPLVQKYLKQVLTNGVKRARLATIHMGGSFKPKPNGSWYPLKYTTEYFGILPKPSFVWDACVSVLYGLLWFAVRDKYHEGKGSMWVTINSLLTMVNAEDPNIDLGALIRYQFEMMWFPTAYLNDNVKWIQLDDTHAKLILKDSGMECSCVFTFDKNGLISQVETKDRPFEKDGKYIYPTWFAQCSDYKEYQGVKIPTKCNVSWRFDDGSEFEYARCIVKDAIYE